jgi:hypothetical protein
MQWMTMACIEGGTLNGEMFVSVLFSALWVTKIKHTKINLMLFTIRISTHLVKINQFAILNDVFLNIIIAAPQIM